MKKLSKSVQLSYLKLSTIPAIFSDIHVAGSFYANQNHLKTLQNSPSKVDWHFDCAMNNLADFVGGPDHVGHYFSCSHNPLTSLKGIPKYVGGDFYAHGILKFTEADIRAVCDVKGSVIMSRVRLK